MHRMTSAAPSDRISHSPPGGCNISGRVLWTLEPRYVVSGTCTPLIGYGFLKVSSSLCTTHLSRLEPSTGEKQIFRMVDGQGWEG
jgi:hypothetical protein